MLTSVKVELPPEAWTRCASPRCKRLADWVEMEALTAAIAALTLYDMQGGGSRHGY
jgi:molybdenum cofactor biosynthesis enzyme